VEILRERVTKTLGQFSDSVSRVEQLPKPVRENPLSAAAAAIICIFLFGWLLWSVSHPAPKPVPISVTPSPGPTPAPPGPGRVPTPGPAPQPTPAPPPSPGPHPTPSPPNPPGPTPSAVVVPAQALGPRPGQPWQNSLGLRLAPLPGSAAHMAIWKTRKGDFDKFAQATGYNANGAMLSSISKGAKSKSMNWQNPGFPQTADHPVVGVNAYDAVAFCQWLTEKERGEGVIDKNFAYRLPTDQEWSAAAGNLLYPWGETWPPADSSGNFAGNEARNAMGRSGVILHFSDGFVATSPVGSFAQNPNGFFDLGGNAMEWCGAWYRRDMNSDDIRRKVTRLEDDGNGKTKLVLRG
jgi:hypothetical protein